MNVGDVISFDNGMCGTVVCWIDGNKCAPGFSLDEWRYLNLGILVETDEAGLIYLETAPENLKMV